MILTDFVFLGTTVPEQMSDGRVVRCSAGYSNERRSLIRVYPISPFVGIRRWDRYRIELELNPKDSRVESYKLAGDRSDPDRLTARLTQNHLGSVPRSIRQAEVDRYLVPSIAYMNQRRMSLGIINPDLRGYTFEHDPVADAAIQQFPGMETPAPEWGRKSFPLRPRIQFCDEDGAHDLSFNEHGAYEWLRKNPDAGRSSLFDNLGFGSSDSECRLLVGNLCNQRTAWVVISYLRLSRQQSSLFDEVSA